MTKFQKFTRSPQTLAESLVFPKKSPLTGNIYEWRSPYLKEGFSSRHEAVKATVVFFYEDAEKPENWNA